MRRPSAYRVFLTHNTEYHVRLHVCFGVRDRRTGHWVQQHPCLNAKLAGTFPDATGHTRSMATPVVGERLSFETPGAPVHTSPVLSVEEREGLDRSMLDSGAEAQRCVEPPENPRDTF